MVVLATFIISGSIALAQDSEGATEQNTLPTPEELKENVDGLGERITLVENDVATLKNLKISGYVQLDWQHFDQTTNAGRAVPGYFEARKDLFTVRRGRIKFQHKLGDWMNAVLQPDITESGLSLREAYVEVLPFSSPVLSIIAGSQNRPNYEVEVSSSNLEALERSQITKAFYPSEYDLGIMLSSKYELFEGFDPKLQLGIFNGPGPVVETDSYKDIIGRLTFPVPLGSESPVQADLGVSYYYGGIPQTGDSIRKTVGETNVVVGNDATGSMAGMGNKNNFNVEAQIFLDLLPFGGTILKGEYMMGSRPTAGTAATAATVGTTKDSTGKDVVKITPGTAAQPLQIRNQGGYYFYFIQNISSLMQLVFKMDMYDRNTDLAGTQVTSTSDAATTVMGLGVNFFVGNMRISALYEIPSFAQNENIQNDPVTKKPSDAFRDADLKDNKTTIRFQYKF